MRAMYFYGFSGVDDQKELPIVHPVVNHHYTFNQPVVGGELSVRSNLTSLSRKSPDFEAITQAAFTGSFCAHHRRSRRERVEDPSNCVLRGVPGTYTRGSSEANWRRTIVDSFGQVFTPFINLRGDVAQRQRLRSGPGVANFIATGQRRRSGGTWPPPAWSIDIPSSTCSPGERKPSSRSPRSS